MKTTVSNIILADPALAEVVTTPLPIVASYQIGRILQAVQDAVKDYSDARLAKAKELAEKDDSGEPKTEDLLDSDGKVIGNKYVLTPESEKELQDEINVLLEKEINIAIDPISITDLGDAEIKPSVFAALNWIFTN